MPHPSAEEVIPIGPGMEHPKLLFRADVTYSQTAWAMKRGGVALAKCVIELDGSLSNCRMVHGIPDMDEPILQSLRSWRYTPVTYRGHPQRVLMTIPVHIAVPQ